MCDVSILKRECGQLKNEVYQLKLLARKLLREGKFQSPDVANSSFPELERQAKHMGVFDT
jgi:hypothetical protein